MTSPTPEELMQAAQEEERQRQAVQQQPAADGGGTSMDVDLDALGMLADGASAVAEGALNVVSAVGGFVGDVLGGLLDL